MYGHFCYARFKGYVDGVPNCHPTLTEKDWKDRPLQVTEPENDALLTGTYCSGNVATCKVCKMPANVPKGFFNKASQPEKLITTPYGGKSYDLAKCPAGTYNDEDWSNPTVSTSCKFCVAGFFGSKTSSQEERSRGSCSGRCEPGYYCVAGSISSQAQKCPAGYYGSSGGHIDSSCDGKCPAGFWCPSGSVSNKAHRCAAGYFGDTAGQITETCSGRCPAGYYCPSGTTTVGAPPTYEIQQALNLDGYSPSSISEPAKNLGFIQAIAQYYGTDADAVRVVSTSALKDGGVIIQYTVATTSASVRDASVTKAKNLIVTEKDRQALLTMLHTLGSLTQTSRVAGLTSPSVSQRDSTASIACVEIDEYCPIGSSAPLKVPSGSRHVRNADGRAYDTTSCDRGTWCINGAVQKCPAGNFGASKGVQTSDCSGACSAGYFCEAGSTRAVQAECGSRAALSGDDPTKYFCPSGSAAPRLVKTGYYTACEDDSTTSCTQKRRVKELPCGVGYLCANGYQKRAVQWDASLCSCKMAADGTESCAPSDQSSTDSDIVLDERPGHDMPPWGSLTYATWGRRLRASWFDPSGASGAVTSFAITNLRRYDFSTAAEAKTCTLTTGSTASLPQFRLDTTSPASATDQRLQYLLNFEDCFGWTFDLVAVSGSKVAPAQGKSVPESTCTFRIRTKNLNDKPYWGEEVVDGDRYGRAKSSMKGAYPYLQLRREVEERSAPNVLVGAALKAVDPDEGQEVRFEIVGGNGKDVFRINTCSGQIFVGPLAKLDYHRQNVYKLNILVYDDAEYFSDGNSLSMGVTTVFVDISDVNDVPVICASRDSAPDECSDVVASFRIYEDAVATKDSTIPTFGSDFVVDLDGDDLTYSIDSSVFDADMFSIDSQTGKITVALGKSLDYESRQLYRITVVLRDYKNGDARGGEARHTFSIAVLDANDAPILRKGIVLHMQENAQIGSNTLNNFAATDTDSASLGQLVYTIMSQTSPTGTGATFMLRESDGQVYVAVKELPNGQDIDYEDSTCPPPCRYSLEIKVRDSGVAGGCGVHCAPKEIVQTIAVEIVDVNEPPSLTTLSLRFNENVPTNADTGPLAKQQLSATDPDGDNLLYFIQSTRTAGQDSTCSQPATDFTKWLTLSSSGMLRSLVPMDFETIASNPFCVQIMVRDTGGLTNALSVGNTGKDTYQSVTVTVVDVNEPPTVATAQEFDVRENTPVLPPPVVGTIVFSDPDQGDQVKLTMKQSDAVFGGVTYFDLRSGAIGGTIELLASPDFEAKSSFSLDFVATDKDGLTGTGTVQVNIIDVNESPMFVSPAMFPVSEHNGNLADCTTEMFCLPGTEVGVVVAVDPDKINGVRESVSYEIDPLSNAGSTFAIDSTTGVIRVGRITDEIMTRDYEFQLRVVARDSRSGLTFMTVVVRVVERNFVPRFTPTATLKSIQEGKAGQGQTLGTIEVKDPDKNYPLTVNIRQTNPSGYTNSIVLEPTPGSPTQFILKTVANAELDYEQIGDGSIRAPRGQICLTIDAFDSAQATASFAGHCVQIMDVNEPPTLNVSPVKVAENEPPGKIGTITASDEDAADHRETGTPLKYSIDPTGWMDANNLPCPFSLKQVVCPSDASQNCAEVFADKTLDYEELAKNYGSKFDPLTSTLRVKIRVTDSKPNFVEETVMIHISDVNEPPMLDTDVGSPIRVLETQVVGAVLATFPVLDPDDVVKRLSFGVSVAGIDQDGAELVTVESVGRSAVVKLAGGIPLDFEDQSSFELTIVVHDGGNGNKAEPSRSSTVTVPVEVQNVNDVTVSDVVYKDPTRAGHTTNGGEIVVITGTNFGPTQRKLSGQVTAVPMTIGVMYGALSYSGVAGAASTIVNNPFVARNCRVTMPNTQMECQTAALDRQVKATELHWSVKIGQDLAAMPSTQVTAYLPPIITSVSAPDQMPTTGGSKIIIRGKNLGDTKAFAVVGLGAVSYSYDLGAQQWAAADCTSQLHEVITCTSTAGTGTNMQWRLLVGGQQSTTYLSNISYAPPSILTISGATGVTPSKLLTTGGENIVIRGSNFGVVGTMVGASYGPDGSGYELPRSACAVTKDQSEITCMTVSGIGANHIWKVYVKSGSMYQWSATTPLAKTSYRGPVLSRIRGANIQDLRTEGGQDILIEGDNFGPATADGSSCDTLGRPIAKYGAPTPATSIIVLGTQTELTAMCCKVLSSKAVSCSSAAGVGRDQSWKLSLGGQGSNVLATKNTGYGPPVLARFQGPGSKDADTEGNQIVEIEGRNFGPARLANGVLLNSVSRVTYGKKGTEYTVPPNLCAIASDNFMVTCKTVKGAGRGMKWLVTIDGQESITPSTSYSPPIISSIRGPAQLNSLGGQMIYLDGSNFGPSPRDNPLKVSPITGKPFLQGITFGPNGLQYAAAKCEVTKSSSEITCETVPGVGGDLDWVVTVEGQSSLAHAWGMYEAPTIATAAPLTGPTQGGTQVTLVGKGLGVLDETSSMQVLFGSMVIEAAVSVVNGQETAQFTVPESHGKDITARIAVKTSTGLVLNSNEVFFSYAPPKIRLLTSKWADESRGLLSVTAEGANFCKNTNCGVVFANGLQASTITYWSHEKIVFTTALDKGEVMLEVGGQKSNTWTFAHLSPKIHPDSITLLNQTTFGTTGGEEIVIKGSFFGRALSILRVTVGGAGGIGSTEAVIVPNGFYPGENVRTPDRLTIKMPPGQGSNQEFIVWRGKTASPAARVTYKSPVVTSVTRVDGSDATQGGAVGPTTGGPKLTVSGREFGVNSYVTVGAIKIDLESQTHRSIVFALPPGEGSDLSIVVWAGNQNSRLGSPKLYTIAYQKPTVSGFSLSARRRVLHGTSNSAGGRRFLAASPAPSRSVPSPPVSPSPSLSPTSPLSPSPVRPAVAPPSAPVVTPCNPTPVSAASGGSSKSLPAGPTLGGQCITIRGSNFGKDLPIIMFGPYPAIIKARDTVGHSWVVVQSPAGQGKDLELEIRVGNQVVVSPYAYLPPRIVSVSPTQGPTSGMTAQGQPIVMTIIGHNFGSEVAAAKAPTAAAQLREVHITPKCNECSEGKVTPYVIRVKATAFFEDTHTMLQFYMPEGFGLGARVTVWTGNQESVELVAFDYSQPNIVSLGAFCGDEHQCRSPKDQFETDGCADMRLWEEFTEWQGRKISALASTDAPSSTSDLARHCGFDNDRWQMAIIEGSSLGSTALALAGAPLRIAVRHAGRDETYFLSTQDCPTCVHTHTRIVARAARGLGRDLNLTVELGDSISNPLPWSFKAPEVMVVESNEGGAISAAGNSEVYVRGRNFGAPSAGGVPVRVFIGVEFSMEARGTPTSIVGFRDARTLEPIDLGRKPWLLEDPDVLANLEGISMKECYTLTLGENDEIVKKGPAQWHPSYNYTIPKARNVDGFPYISCSPQRDVTGPKNVTLIIGTQMDSCATNYRLCADPISTSDRRMKRPASYCEDDTPATPIIPDSDSGDTGSGVSPFSNETAIAKVPAQVCRDDKFCSWDCFSSSLVTTQCGVDPNGPASYAKAGQLCASVNSIQASCADSNCMSPDARKGFYRLTVDIDCKRDTTTGECKKDPAMPGGVAWLRPAEAERAMGTNTIPLPNGTRLPRCPVERWEPLTEPEKYKAEFAGIQEATECFDIVSCHPKEACLGGNVCSEGYQYTYFNCLQQMDKIGEVSCMDDEQCRKMDKTGKFTLPFKEGQASYSQPQSQSRCVQKEVSPGLVQGRCECFASPRCALCTTGNRNPITPSYNETLTGELSPFWTKGYYRLNNKCEQCPDQPGLIVAMFFVGIVALCIGGWFLSKKQFNVAFISIGVDYFQVLALFARSEIEWPPLMRKLFELCSIFNFNIDITAPECLIPDLDYWIKWAGIMALPIGAFVLLSLVSCAKIIHERRATRGSWHVRKQLSSVIALYLMTFYYLYLAVTRRALDIFNCNPSTPSDGYLYTEFTSTKCEGGLCKCYIPGSLQSMLVTPAALFIALYTVGFPLFIGCIIYKHRDSIMEDQVLRAHDLLSSATKGSDKAHEVRKRYHKMYYHFKPQKIYWILVIISRKLGIAVAGLMLRQNPGFQLAVCLCILFICYVAQVKHKPYMSTSQRQEVVRDHREKVKQFEKLHRRNEKKPALLKLHKRIETHLQQALELKRDQEAKKIRSQTNRTAAQELKLTDGTEANEEGNAVEKSFYFDYNTVECVLLGSAILVCLSGIMFENERFKVRDDLMYQKDVITYLVVFVIFGSIFYYCVVFVAEVFAWHPQWLIRIFGSGKMRKAIKALKKSSEAPIDIDDVVLAHSMKESKSGGTTGSQINPLHSLSSHKSLSKLTSGDMVIGNTDEEKALEEAESRNRSQQHQIEQLTLALKRYKKEFDRTVVTTSASLGADEGGSGGRAESNSSDHGGRPGLWTPRSRRNVRKAESPSSSSYKLPASAKRPVSRHGTSEDTASGTTMTVELKAIPASSSPREMTPQGKQGKKKRPSAFGQMTQLHRAQSFKFDSAQQEEEDAGEKATTTTTTTRTVDAREHEKTNPLATRRSQRRIQPRSDLTVSRQESSRASAEDSPSLSPQWPPSAKASQRVAANEGVSDRVQSFEIGGAGQNATFAAASAVDDDDDDDDDERVRKLLEQAGSELGSSQRFRNSISSPSPGAPGGAHHSFADGSSAAVAVEEDTAIADEVGEDGSGSDAWDGQL